MMARDAIGSLALVSLFVVAGVCASNASEPDPTRIDPYKNFQFRLKWDGREVAGASKVSMLDSSGQAVDYRSGGDPSTSRKSSGRSKYDAITVERGVTYDPAFQNWANTVWQMSTQPGSEVSLANFRKDIYLEAFDDPGNMGAAYVLHRCTVSELQAAHDINSDPGAATIEHIKFACEGWERDPSVNEPPQTK